MHKANYEILPDGTFYGEIPGCQGVYANTDNFASCREELQGALEDWILLGLTLNHFLPVIDGIDLTIHKEVA
jgi:predicted RNase H-like HicB family nuclease